MENIKINAYQMFVLVVLFEMGSAILFAVGAEAKQDAWIAILLGVVGGILIFLIYYRLYLFYPDIPLKSYVQKITGKWIGQLIGIFYIVYFIYQATRVLRDIGGLLVTVTYTSTPIFVINTLMILTIIYALHKGFEVIARVAEVYFFIIYLLAIFGFILILFSGLIHLENLQPILENGVNPVLKTFLGQTINYPFGEMIVFTMLLPYLNDQKKAKKICIGGILLGGLNILITTVINIACIGVDYFVRSPYPLLSTISKIELGFIERLDVFFMLYLVIGGFFKITLYYYAAVVGAADIFKFKNYRNLGFPIGLIILFASNTIASNFAEHIKEGVVVIPIYLHWPLQIIIPVILLIIAFFRNMGQKL
ncbi:spore germination protein [Neobacillus pocheonensis]|uniref:Spore germination protein n=1 Tax=Neobacillus pocheonensis TaxID=363869 RepID=A0ABT0W5V8_9BACI|nr:spore germination protein [Neobacillus pocheonensis]